MVLREIFGLERDTWTNTFTLKMEAKISSETS